MQTAARALHVVDESRKDLLEELAHSSAYRPVPGARKPAKDCQPIENEEPGPSG